MYPPVNGRLSSKIMATASTDKGRIGAVGCDVKDGAVRARRRSLRRPGGRGRGSSCGGLERGADVSTECPRTRRTAMQVVGTSTHTDATGRALRAAGGNVPACSIRT